MKGTWTIRLTEWIKMPNRLNVATFLFWVFVWNFSDFELTEFRFNLRWIMFAFRNNQYFPFVRNHFNVYRNFYDRSWRKRGSWTKSSDGKVKVKVKNPQRVRNDYTELSIYTLLIYNRHFRAFETFILFFDILRWYNGILCNFHFLWISARRFISNIFSF